MIVSCTYSVCGLESHHPIMANLSSVIGCILTSARTLYKLAQKRPSLATCFQLECVLEQHSPPNRWNVCDIFTQIYNSMEQTCDNTHGYSVIHFCKYLYFRPSCWMNVNCQVEWMTIICRGGRAKEEIWIIFGITYGCQSFVKGGGLCCSRHK